ncbi:hypothetical protein PILCRDRAFT_26727, partial [Piloderma croceum F 1598]
RPPVIMPGKLTPDLLFDFENGAYSYFSFKDIKVEKEVSKVAGGLQDGRVQTWYRLNRAAVDAAGFPAFMATVRESWLEPGWEQDVKLTILASHQGSTPIVDWIMLLEATNTLLHNHVCKLSDNDLRNHIQSHVHPDTMTAATVAELHLIVEYDKYKSSLKVVDDACVRSDELLKAAVKQLMLQPPLSGCRTASNRNTASSSTSTSTTAVNNSIARTPDRVPALTTKEHTLLVEHEGCFKCRRFYTSHRLSDCPDGFPDKTSYVTLTNADALMAKRKQGKKEKPAKTAAIIPMPAAIVMPSAVLGEGSDSEYVDIPFFVPYFFLDCSVGGATASSIESIRALIDHGSDAVLIDPALADQMQLKRHKLPAPKEVVMAVGDGKEIFTFDEWVPITVTSVDKAWTSHACRAILAPNLCVPLLLGGPFLLLTHRLVIDHETCTCIDKKCGYDLLNPPVIKYSITKPSPK